ncbi:MAG: SPOR domain-containing protein [Desulfotignum sp.]
MIRGLRNIFVRLWVTTLVTVPLCFYIMPWVRQVFSGPGPVFFALGMVITGYVLIGFLMNFLGEKLIERLIREAQMWERAAIFNRAGTKYLQAVRMYDSFLLSPLSVGKMTTRLTGALARFSLTFDRENEIFRQAVLVYLASNPRDETLAGLWLRRLCKNRAVDDKEEDLLTRLANIHHTSPKLMPFLTRLFLDLGRVDFTAKQLYARVLEIPSLKQRYGKDIHTLLEEPAQQLEQEVMYPAREMPRQSLPSASQKKISDIISDIGMDFFTGLRHVIQSVRTGVVFCFGFAARYARRLMTRIQVKDRWRFYLKAGVLGFIFLGLLVFMYNTVSHLLRPGTVDEIEVIIEKKISKPFTIQVAAYLKESHADKYLKILRQNSIDARIKKTGGGGKTWYLIQVSEFADKADATAYGNHLKKKNIIEDFFVSNK